MKRIALVVLCSMGLNGCGLHTAVNRSDRRLNGLDPGQKRATSVYLLGEPTVPRAGLLKDDKTKIRVDEYNLFRSEKLGDYILFGVMTLSVIWWFDPPSFLKRRFWVEYNNETLVRWGEDFNKKFRGDILVRQQKMKDSVSDMEPSY